MIIIFLIAILIVLLITYAIVRLSISCVIWSFNMSTDIRDIYKICFPYYIIGLTGIGIAFIITSNALAVSIYYFAVIYLMALLTWRKELKKGIEKQSILKIAVESNQSQLP